MPLLTVMQGNAVDAKAPDYREASQGGLEGARRESGYRDKHQLRVGSAQGVPLPEVVFQSSITSCCYPYL